ncbi:ABC transporter permease [Aliikangiella sp. IMCC44359]|uniref:ABC transporter permease n=1 Tax=Aliikangiella sp. IMCC44359 TaxID=3459125 RepID=UPI00403AC59B
MSENIQVISFYNLAFAFVPVIIAMIILVKWSINARNASYAIVRMLIQLLLIGYFLTYIFKSDSSAIILIVLFVMVLSSSWIALGSLSNQRTLLYKYALLSISLGGGIPLLLITQGVLQLTPWYQPQFMIPLAGMIFANAMNSISLAVERFNSEIESNTPYNQARNKALNASLIPVINSLFAVGLVSLPGMMTGQILSGVSPLIAVRYQIMVMCMVFGSSVLSAACFLVLVKPIHTSRTTQS